MTEPIQPDYGKLVWEDDTFAIYETEMLADDAKKVTRTDLLIQDKETNMILTGLEDGTVVLALNFQNQYKLLAKRVATDAANMCKQEIESMEIMLKVRKEQQERYEKVVRVYNITEGISGDSAPGKIII